MRAVKSKPRFHCDFCSRVSTEEAMAKHERICWRNPNRYCPTCKNTDRVVDEFGSFPCPFCLTRAS